MNTLNIDSLNKNLNGKQILSGIHLSLKTGEIKGLLGRNGSGKSTLLKLLFGAFKADNIYFSINGKVIKNHLKFYQYLSLSPQWVCLPKNIKVKALLKLTDRRNFLLYHDFLGKHHNDKVGELSFGTQKYLQTLLILHNDAPFCLLDEPFSGLSPVLKEKLKELILQKSKEKAVLIADHNYNDLKEISSVIYLLHQSNIFQIDELGDLIRFGYWRAD